MSIQWQWPQYVIAAIVVLKLAVQIGCDGQPRENYNAGYGVGDFILWIFILHSGGFW